jgi:hypothetical protein
VVRKISGEHWKVPNCKSLRNWTPELVIQLNSVSNQTTHVVDFWLDSILGGYIT